jgi:hypothetical protein
MRLLCRCCASTPHQGAVALLNDAVIGLPVSRFRGGAKHDVAALERERCDFTGISIVIQIVGEMADDHWIPFRLGLKPKIADR